MGGGSALSKIEHADGDLVYFGATNHLRDRTLKHYTGESTKHFLEADRVFASKEFAAHHSLPQVWIRNRSDSRYRFRP